MSLLNKANIITTPTAYSVGKLHSVKPENEIYADFDFARNSSATRVGENGLIQSVAANLPRINYENGIGHFLLEPQRTNLVTYSEQFDNAAWTKTNCTTSTNVATAPDGNTSADKLIMNNGLSPTSADADGIYQERSITSGVYNVSFFVKAAEFNSVNVRDNAVTGAFLNINLTTGAVTNPAPSQFVGAQSVNYGNGWYRVSFTTTTIVATQAFSIRAGQTGDGTSGFLLWGVQYELGAYETSYIPTLSAAATRLAEVCDGSGNASTFNDSEGVLMAQIGALADDSSLRTITLGDGSSQNAVSFRYDNPNQITLYLNSGGVNQFSFVANVQTLSFNKCLIKYKANDFSAWVNGFEIGTDTSGITFPSNTLDRINFDIGYTSSDPFYGKTKQLQYFDSALTDSELETLTSWMSFSDMAIDLNYTIQ